MRLGIGSYTFGWASGTFPHEISQEAQRGGFATLSACDLIDKAVALDVPVVQICVLPDLAAMGDDELYAIRDYAVARGKDLEIGTMGSDPDHLLNYLRIAQLVGASLVRSIFTTSSLGLVNERKDITQVAGEYAAAKVFLALENYESAGFLDFKDLCEAIDNEYVGICLDTVNSLGRGEGVAEVTTALMPYTKCLHIKDFAVIRHESNAGFDVIGTPAGEGRLDLVRHMTMLKQTLPDASIILEQWTPIVGGFEEIVTLEDEWARISIANMKSALAQVDSAK